MTAPEPTRPADEHTDAVAEAMHASAAPTLQGLARAILTPTDPAVHLAMLDALVRAGVLTEEWAVQYECDLSTPRMSGETERTITTQVPSEDRARQAVRNYAPINARNRRVARRHATPWEVAQ